MKGLALIFVVFVFIYALYVSPLVQAKLRPVLVSGRRKSLSFCLPLCIAILLPAMYTLTVYNRSFPMPEGWYTLFSQYIHQGKLPYRDFEFLYTPGYAYIIAGITKLFGYKILVLRIVGVALFSGLSCVLFFVFRKIFAPWIASIAACTAVFYLQSELPQIFYDYIRFYDLFNFLTALCLLGYVSCLLKISLSDSPINSKQKGNTFSLMLYAGGMGFCAGIGILIRQNSGFVLLAYCMVILIFLLFWLGFSLKKMGSVLIFLIAAGIPPGIVLLLLQVNDLLPSYMQMTTGDALASKGGLSAVLWGWLPRSLPFILSQWKSLLFLGLFLFLNALGFYKQKPKHMDVNPKKTFFYTGRFLFSLFVGLEILFFVFIWTWPRLSEYLILNIYPFLSPYSIFILLFLLFLLMVGWLIVKKQKKNSFLVLLMVLCGYYIATAYGSATSAGFSEGQSAIGIGILVGLILHWSFHKYHKEVVSLGLALIVLLGMSGVARKIDLPYSWWQLEEESVRLSTHKVNIPLLQGIYVSQKRKLVLESVYQDIITHTESKEAIFIFPHLSFLYAATERYPETFTLVQWFDVSSEQQILLDLERLKNSPPKVLVICDIPTWVMKGHEKLFRGGEKSAQRRMLEGLKQLAKERAYDLIGVYDLENGYKMKVYVLKP